MQTPRSGGYAVCRSSRPHTIPSRCRAPTHRLPLVNRVDPSPTGLAYLAMMTELLQACRRADATAGIWEAADLQWWWRKDQHKDPTAQAFWLEEGSLVAAAILTDWGGRWGFDVLGGRALTGSEGSAIDEAAWSFGIEMVDRLGLHSVEASIREDDDLTRDIAVARGFEPAEGGSVTLWTEAGERAPARALPPGFRIEDRASVRASAMPHPMIPRNGEHVEARLQECSLYRPDLDLSVRAPAGAVAGYALFWADPVTGVGLVEPMRTEDPYQGRGVGRGLLAEGLTRLSAAGCRRLKVGHLVGNEVARRLYEGAGFRPAEVVRSFIRTAG
jgi:GNAT superfamily N-acetyltransferase